MASIRERTKAHGTVFWSVLYRLDGKQTSTSFGDFAEASQFREIANKFGIRNALAAVAAQAKVHGTAGFTVEGLTHHVDHLTGVDPNTVAKYCAYIANDVDEVFGLIPLTALSRDHVVQWIKRLQLPDGKGRAPAAKTIANKQGFVAGALNGAVAAGHLDANPSGGLSTPRDDDPREMVFLSREQFVLLHSRVTEYWQPLVEFLVASGARWGEVAALRPSDVDRAAGTVRISRSWKQGSGGYRLGATKTSKSGRTINVPKATLEKLDYSGEFLFQNRAGGPVRAQGFHQRVWSPAVERAWPSVDGDGNAISPELRPRPHDLRHTAASWMIAAGVPLPVIQQHLGHESIQTTIGVYGHLDRRSMQIAADALGSMVCLSGHGGRYDETVSTPTVSIPRRNMPAPC